MGQPLGASKGFGFLSFKNHENALSALRKLNNNPNVFGKNSVSKSEVFSLLLGDLIVILYSRTATDCRL